MHAGVRKFVRGEDAMSRRTGAISVLWICALAVCAPWRLAAAGEAMAAGVQEAKSQLGDLEAARNALGNAAALQAHKAVIDLEIKQQKDLVARETELQEARGQVAALKADMEKLQAAAKQRDGELADRTKERESLEAKNREELSSLRSQLEKSEASLGAERKDREKAAADANRLEGEKQKLEAQLSQMASAKPPAAAQAASAKEGDKAAGAEQLASLRSQVEKLEASIAEQRKEREKAETEVKRLKDEGEKLEARLAQQPKAMTQPLTEEAAAQPSGAPSDGTRIKKWQKPDGSLFFGERAPPGSKLLGEVENLGTSGGSEAATSPPR
jgi:chromosome segregation ATPase